MARRPPKPAGVPSSPRHKQRNPTRPAATSLEIIGKQLNDLTAGVPTLTDLSAIQERARAENNDRGAAIVIATNLEKALEYAIERKLQLSEEQRDELFRMIEAPARSFHRKTILASAIRIIGPETRRNLDIVRRIRNAFAHARRPITFQTPAITAACYAIVMPSLFQQISAPHLLDTESHETDPRNKYRIVC